MNARLYWLTALLLMASCAVAATNSQARLQADSAEYDAKLGCMIFESNVVVTLDDMTLRADRVTAYQEPGSDAPKGRDSFSRIVAIGHVRLKTSQYDVTGERGVYVSATRTVQVTGNPQVVLEGGQRVWPTVITYDLNTDKLSFQGGVGGTMTVTDEVSKDWKGFNPLDTNDKNGK